MSAPKLSFGGAFIREQARPALIWIAPILPRPKDRKYGEYDSDANDEVANRYLGEIAFLNSSLLRSKPANQEQGTYREEHSLNRVVNHWYLHWLARQQALASHYSTDRTIADISPNVKADSVTA
jgi:hypothetical protein